MVPGTFFLLLETDCIKKYPVAYSFLSTPLVNSTGPQSERQDISVPSLKQAGLENPAYRHFVVAVNGDIADIFPF
jgi:hypothetical protein